MKYLKENERPDFKKLINDMLPKRERILPPMFDLLTPEEKLKK